MKKINTIIFDWAGTTVDFGSYAPVDAFIKAFETFGITPTVEETRQPMGLPKIVHIEKMLQGERLSALWKEGHGRTATSEDINQIYQLFEPALFAVLNQYAEPLPGVIDTVDKLREIGMKIGSTTGYTDQMMKVVAPLAAGKGYEPDCIVAPDEVGGKGRPYPYMLWRNLEKLECLSIEEVIKVGDTEADMAEGKNAGCISVGVLEGSSMLGLSQKELEALDVGEKKKLFKYTRERYSKAGADYVIDRISQLPALIESINEVREGK